MNSAPQRPRRWLYWLFAVLAIIFACALFLFVRLRNIDEQVRALVIEELGRRFDSQVELRFIHVRLWPLPGVTGEDLTIHFHRRLDVPPLIQIGKFSASVSLFELLRTPHHVSTVQLQNMVITISHRQPAAEKSAPASPKLDPIPRSIIFDRILCNDANLVLIPRKEGKEPLDFEIHNLVLTGLNAQAPFAFHGDLTNAKPKGEIATSGNFGPWNLDDPGSTPVSGSYEFANADLGPFPGIAGILSSTGKYAGPLNKLDVKGATDTPDFSLDHVGHPVPLHTDYSATVDGTDGDTYLHPVRAVLGRSLMIANGSVVRVPASHGHLIALDVSAPQARLEDILALAINSEKPPMTGIMKLKTKLTIPPGTAKALDKMILDGDFVVDDGHFTSQDLSAKLESLSRHAMGEPNNPDAGSAITGMTGHYHLEKGVVTLSNLNFSVEGATVLLDGTFALRGGALDFHGQLRLKAALSQTVTGAKSVFLKPFDPFFKRKGAGAVIPISITGTYQQPIFGVSIFHKTIKRQLGSPASPAPKH